MLKKGALLRSTGGEITFQPVQSCLEIYQQIQPKLSSSTWNIKVQEYWILKYDFWNLISCFWTKMYIFPLKYTCSIRNFSNFQKGEKWKRRNVKKTKKRNKIQRPERVKVWKTKRLKDKKADIKIQRPEREFYIVMSGQCCTLALFLISSIPHVPCQLNNVD